MSMTHDEMISVIQAHRDGKDVQLRWRDNGLVWITVKAHPNWHFDRADYRIKPEPPKPREWWLRNRECGCCWNVSDSPFLDPGYPGIHVREVLPEETP